MRFRAILFLTASSLLAAPLAAAVAAAPYQVGSANVAVVQAPIPVPAVTPCRVNLYRNAKFNPNNVNFTYTPPAGCPGPYGAIVLSVEVWLNAGVQYDRTGTIWIGGVPLWFGTTAEPDPKLAPSWHFERNVTDYASLLATANSGFVSITNYVSQQDNSVINSNADLLFYPATKAFPAPEVPDQIIPLAAPGGGTVALNTSTDTVAIDQTLPTNIRNASLDVFLQGQSNDEFWYTCVPTSLSSELESCGGGSLREGEITVDGQPAGVAPVFPWIFTGGIDPFLWAPIPAVQTLSFKPFRVPLAPFAGVLSDGTKAHQIGLSVYGANSYFSVAGALFLYLDKGSTQVTGGVTQNTLAATPTPVITTHLGTHGPVTTGTVATESQHNFAIAGNIVTSTGPVQYTVHELEHFSNLESFRVNGLIVDIESITQRTDTGVYLTTTTARGTNTHVVTQSYPLSADITLVTLPNTNLVQGTQISQTYDGAEVSLVGNTENTVRSHDNITAADDLVLTSSFGLVGHRNASSTATLSGSSTTAPCYGVKLASKNNVLTSAVVGCGK